MLGILIAAALAQAAVSDPIPAICSLNNSIPENCAMLIGVDEENAAVAVATSYGILYLLGPKTQNQQGFRVNTVSIDEGDPSEAYGSCQFTPGVLRCNFTFLRDPDNTQFKLEVVNPNVQP